MVRQAFGDALGKIERQGTGGDEAQAILDEVRDTLRSLKGRVAQREHVFGCTLFSDFNVAPFDIGPVKFEPRGSWLLRKEAVSAISNTTARRIRRAWSGTKLQKRKHSLDAMYEDDILAAIGSCPYVCSVSTVDLAAEAGRLKAQVAARLALTAISLRWETPSRTLDGLKLSIDLKSGSRRSLVFVRGKITSGWERRDLPYVSRVSSESWLDELHKHEYNFSVSGEAISYFLNPSRKEQRRSLMSTLAQALLWFHEGCREELAVISVVKFCACLDALAVGKKSEGIRNLIRARLKIKDDEAMLRDGSSMKVLVGQIYSQGRSLAIHGINPKIGYDWSEMRAVSEWLARQCLAASLHWSAQNPTLSDPLQLQH